MTERRSHAATGGANDWALLQAKLESALKTLKEAEDRHRQSTAAARKLLQDSDAALHEALENARGLVASVAAIPPGTFPNVMESHGR